jgi:hypothetical protein
MEIITQSFDKSWNPFDSLSLEFCRSYRTLAILSDIGCLQYIYSCFLKKIGMKYD